MWCTPTSGLLRAAASVLAALEPTPRQPVMPMLYVFSKASSETHSPVATENTHLVRACRQFRQHLEHLYWRASTPSGRQKAVAEV